MKTLKNFFAVIICAAALINVVPMSAQDPSGKDDKEWARKVKKDKEDFYKRSPKEAVKQAKQWTKEGWKSMNLPLEKQFERTWAMLAIKEGEVTYKYVSKEVIGTGTNMTAAQMQAENVAKVRIAGELCSEVAAQVDLGLANSETNAELTASMSKAVEVAKIIFAQKMGKVYTGVTAYRERKNLYEVQVVVLYDRVQGMNAARMAVLDELAKETGKSREQLESLLGVENK